MAPRRTRPTRPGSAPQPPTAPKTRGDLPHGCEISELFRVLGKTYMLDILHLFTREGARPLRFVELQAKLSLSPNTLSDRLKELVKSGLLSRTSYNEIPPRVDYAATPKALDLKPVFESLLAWSGRHNLNAEPAALKSVTETLA